MIIDGSTRVVGIVADPIGHVQTPQIMNRIFRETKTNAVIVPFHVSASDLATVINTCRRIRNVAGLIVTVPHKVPAASICDTLGEAGNRVGAVNAIRFEGNGVFGDMFDGRGFVQGLSNANVRLTSLTRTYLAGAGGAAKAIADALLEAGVRHLTIGNRTQQRAIQLVDRLTALYPTATIQVGGADVRGHDLVINASAAGLRSNDAPPVELSSLAREMIVAEVVAEPAVTPLLAAAQASGCQVVPGRNMLDAQVSTLAAYILNEPKLRSWLPRD